MDSCHRIYTVLDLKQAYEFIFFFIWLESGWGRKEILNLFSRVADKPHRSLLMYTALLLKVVMSAGFVIIKCFHFQTVNSQCLFWIKHLWSGNFVQWKGQVVLITKLCIYFILHICTSFMFISFWFLPNHICYQITGLLDIIVTLNECVANWGLHCSGV